MVSGCMMTRAAGGRGAAGDVLVGHVDHAGVTVRVDMGELVIAGHLVG